MGIGVTEGLLLLAIGLVCFGGKKLPELGKTFGASIKGFKEGLNTKPAEDDKNNSDKKDA